MSPTESFIHGLDEKVHTVFIKLLYSYSVYSAMQDLSFFKLVFFLYRTI